MIPDGATPCPLVHLVPACCQQPQKEWVGELPPPIEIGQWRREDRGETTPQREVWLYCHVRRELPEKTRDGFPLFEIDLYDADMRMRDTCYWRSVVILRCWPEALPGRPEKPAPAPMAADGDPELVEAPARSPLPPEPPRSEAPPAPSGRRSVRTPLALVVALLGLTGLPTVDRRR